MEAELSRRKGELFLKIFRSWNSCISIRLSLSSQKIRRFVIIQALRVGPEFARRLFRWRLACTAADQSYSPRAGELSSGAEGDAGARASRLESRQFGHQEAPAANRLVRRVCRR